jgi:hypothetical protein
MTTHAQPCGFCRGTGRVPGPTHDRYGPRSDYPPTVACEYCGGSGTVKGGERLLPHSGKPYRAEGQ